MPAEHANLALYFLIVLGVVALPGLDMGVVLASSLAGGRRAGFAAIVGVILSGVGHVVVGLLGVSAVLRVLPAAFNAVLLVGSAYVASIAVSMIRSRPAAPAAKGGAATLHGALARGLLTNALNPKACLYTLAILPQFVRPEYGPLLPQAAAIVVINAATQLSVYGVVAVVADRGRVAMASRPVLGLVVARTTGVLLLGAAALTAWEGWHCR